MVNDTKLKSLSEALLNIMVGFWINFSLNIIIFPHFGIPFNVMNYLIIGGFYTITSLIRQYPFRRMFNMIWKKQPKKGTLAETSLDLVIGYLFGYVSGLIILPYFGMTHHSDIIIVTIISTIVTAIRRYFFRRLFNHYGSSENLYTLSIRFISWIRHNERRIQNG